jgi:hypothetical protein
VDDSRQTLEYAVRELQADIAAQEAALAAAGRPVPATQLGVFVIHNKQRPKVGALPQGVPQFVAQVRGWGGFLCFLCTYFFIEDRRGAGSGLGVGPACALVEGVGGRGSRGGCCLLRM